MPIINMPIRALLERVNRDGEVLREQEIAETVARMGCEVEEVAAIGQFLCSVCGKVIERTEAQGEPLNCSNCGTDFRERPDALEQLGENKVVRLDMLAVRPDIFDAGGMARYIRGYLGVQTGLAAYPVAPPKITVKVDPKLASDESYRPFISCAVLRKAKFDTELIKMLMNLQEDLHWALGRNRKLASIGVYDLDALRGETFHYDAVAPDGLRFLPLGFDPKADSPLTPGEILKKHKTGQAFAHLLKNHRAYPILRDAEGTVLSMPPIINSESTRVSLESTNLFVDVTGESQRTVERALNIVVTSLRELMPSLEIEGVRIDARDGRRVTPDLEPTSMTLSVREAADTIGVALDAPQLAQLLEKMGHAVSIEADDRLRVGVAAWRNDVMHAVDLIEDAAIAYGYDNIPHELVPTFTIGSPRVIEERSAIVRRVLSGLGFHQVMTLTLTSAAAAFEKWGLEPHPRAVVIENPISTEQTICRVSLMPGLLETLAINKQHDLPQHIFEVGDGSFLDADSETGAGEERLLAAAMIGAYVGYADVRAVLDAFAHEMELELRVEPTEHPGFIPGRVACLKDAGGAQMGVMGEVHPRVLENYGLRHPTAVLEVNLQTVLLDGE